MLRLPPELRSYVWEYVGLTTPYSAFILVAGETSRLACYLSCPRSEQIALERGLRLTTKMITIFGTEYIQDLVKDNDSEAHFEILGVVTGLKFAASPDGICAIKLLGIDWETGWLGKTSHTGNVWHGMIRGMIPTLHCSYNVS